MATPQLPVRVYSRQGGPPAGAQRANVTSGAANSAMGVLPFGELSPFFIGPVTIHPGRQPIEARRQENGYQHSKVYRGQVDAAGNPSVVHAKWMLKGIAADRAERYPMGRGAKPLFSIWRNRKLGYTEARLRIYVPTYVEGICRDPAALRAYGRLRALHKRLSAAGGELALFDFDGRDHVGAGEELAVVMSSSLKKMGHAFVLAAMLEDRLIETVQAAAALAGCGPIPRWDLPPDLRPFGASEQVPGLAGGAVVSYRPDFLNTMADRYFALFSPGGAAEIPWARGTIVVWGRECKESHDTAHFGDPGTSYRYSNASHTPLPWSTDPTGALVELLEIVRLVTGKPFNYCLMNKYEPMESIGAHSDDERDLVEDVGVFSVSLGRARTFLMDAKARGGAIGRPFSQSLAHGSALWMQGLTQRTHKHRVEAEPMRPNETGPTLRVNLTFRAVVVKK
jgi:alkylated DNA repair dioxygenase AlkB